MGGYLLIAALLFFVQPHEVVYPVKSAPSVTHRADRWDTYGLSVRSASGWSVYVDSAAGMTFTVPDTWTMVSRDVNAQTVSFRTPGLAGGAAGPSVDIGTVTTTSYADEYVAEIAAELETQAASISSALAARFRSRIWDVDYTRPTSANTVHGHVLIGDLGTGVSLVRVEWPVATDDGPYRGFLDGLIDIAGSIEIGP